jgi:2-C-methyl-D-erythritol 4-phosphate cytidylyltransferase
VAAAGHSRRMGAIDKIFTTLAGKPLLWHVLSVFQECHAVDMVALVLAEANIEPGKRLVEQGHFRKVTAVCPGGDRRQDSVAAGLSHLKGCTWVIVHDGARPCITSSLIEQGLEAAARHTGAAVAAVPAKETVKIVDASGTIVHTPPRNDVWIAQTPQVFRFDIIEQAYSQNRQDVTDDATLVEALGHQVRVFMGAYENLKVTTPEDIALAESILKARDAGRHRV